MQNLPLQSRRPQTSGWCHCHCWASCWFWSAHLPKPAVSILLHYGPVKSYTCWIRCLRLSPVWASWDAARPTSWYAPFSPLPASPFLSFNHFLSFQHTFMFFTEAKRVCFFGFFLVRLQWFLIQQMTKSFISHQWSISVWHVHWNPVQSSFQLNPACHLTALVFISGNVCILVWMVLTDLQAHRGCLHEFVCFWQSVLLLW